MEYSMYKYILVCTYTCLDVQTKNSMYWYILVCTDHVTGFRGKHRHLEGWQTSISKFGTSISVYPDIEVLKLRYRSSEKKLRYRVRYWTSISKFKTSISYLTKKHQTSISKFWTSMSACNDIEDLPISKFWTSISVCNDIEDFTISKFRTSISVYTDIEVFADIEAINFDMGIYLYRSFDFDIEVLTSISVYSIYRYRRLRYRKFCSLIRSWIYGRCRLPTSVACCLLCTSACNSSHSTANQGSFHVGCSWAYASPFPWPPCPLQSQPWSPGPLQSQAASEAADGRRRLHSGWSWHTEGVLHHLSAHTHQWLDNISYDIV